MMFFRLIKQLYLQGMKEKLLMIITIIFAASLISSVLTVSFDIGDKLNKELKSYGANIRIVPEVQTGLSQIDTNATNANYINEADIGKIKTIFWTNNILDFTPYLTSTLSVDGLNREVTVVGTYFQKEVKLPTGKTMTTGLKSMKEWWEIDGNWVNDQKQPNGMMIGKTVADKLNVKPGDSLTISASNGAKKEAFLIKGIVSGGELEENQIYIPLKIMQGLLNVPNKVAEIEVSALTVPDNDLSERAGKNPELLSEADYETWYCTAFVGAISYQIEEVIPGADAKVIRQISDSEGKILNKVEKLMFALSVVALISAALGVSNLMLTKALERQKEIGLMKALGANNRKIITLFLVEGSLLALVAGTIGFFIGVGLSQWLGQGVFQSFIMIKWFVLPITLVLSVLVILIGSLSALRYITNLKPTDVLYKG